MENASGCVKGRKNIFEIKNIKNIFNIKIFFNFFVFPLATVDVTNKDF